MAMDGGVLGVVPTKESPSIAAEVLNINAKDNHLTCVLSRPCRQEGRLRLAAATPRGEEIEDDRATS